MSLAGENRAIARSAALIYAGAVVEGLVETAIPGGPEFSLLPGFAALAIAPLAALLGPRLSRRALFALGPLGAMLVAFALASTQGESDAAVMYMWPVLWTAAFYGRRGTIAIIACIGVAHGVALATMPPGVGNLDRWVDVVVSVAVVGAVVRGLAARNERLVGDLKAEARVDALTGLLNRRGFEERLAVETARATRDGSRLAVVTFDLDHSSASTTSGATRRATARWPRSARWSASTSAPATWPRGGAARSSSSSCRGQGPPRPMRWPSACAPRSPRPASASASAPASERPRPRSTRGRCSPRPTRRCTRRSGPDATGRLSRPPRSPRPRCCASAGPERG